MYQYVKKNPTVPKCGQCKEKLKGIRPTRPCERSRISKRQKTVARTYGGVLCHRCLRERIVRAFLVEEQKIVKALQNQQRGLLLKQHQQQLQQEQQQQQQRQKQHPKQQSSSGSKGTEKKTPGSKQAPSGKSSSSKSAPTKKATASKSKGTGATKAKKAK